MVFRGVFIFGFFLSNYKKIQKEEMGYEIFKIFTGCQHVRNDAPAEIVKWCGNKYYINGSGTSYNIFSATKKYGIKSVTKTSSTSKA